MLPDEPNAPPAIENAPPTMLTGTGTLMPVITTPAESIGVDKATLVCGANLNALGVTIATAAAVVAVKLADTPPMFTVTEVGVKFTGLDSNCTTTF